LYEKGGNTIRSPAIAHFAVDTIIPVLAAEEIGSVSRQAVIIWMDAAMIIPYTAFIFLKTKK
jgi:hypothetical protein